VYVCVDRDRERERQKRRQRQRGREIYIVILFYIHAIMYVWHFDLLFHLIFLGDLSMSKNIAQLNYFLLFSKDLVWLYHTFVHLFGFCFFSCVVPHSCK
jgi:hypothetical protein